MGSFQKREGFILEVCKKGNPLNTQHFYHGGINKPNKNDGLRKINFKANSIGSKLTKFNILAKVNSTMSQYINFYIP